MAPESEMGSLEGSGLQGEGVWLESLCRWHGGGAAGDLGAGHGTLSPSLERDEQHWGTVAAAMRTQEKSEAELGSGTRSYSLQLNSCLLRCSPIQKSTRKTCGSGPVTPSLLFGIIAFLHC